MTKMGIKSKALGREVMFSQLLESGQRSFKRDGKLFFLSFQCIPHFRWPSLSFFKQENLRWQRHIRRLHCRSVVFGLSSLC